MVAMVRGRVVANDQVYLYLMRFGSGQRAKEREVGECGGGGGGGGESAQRAAYSKEENFERCASCAALRWPIWRVNVR